MAKGGIVRRGSIGIHTHPLDLVGQSIDRPRHAGLIRELGQGMPSFRPSWHIMPTPTLNLAITITSVIGNHGTLCLGHLLTNHSARGRVLLVGDVQEARTLVDHTRPVSGRGVSLGEEAGRL